MFATILTSIMLLGPASADGLDALATAVERDDPPAAREAANARIAADERDVTAWLALGWAELRANRLVDARAALTRAMTLAPSLLPEAEYLSAVAAYLDGDAAEAERLALAARVPGPFEEPAEELLARIEDDRVRAREERFEAILSEGERHFLRGDFEAAIGGFDRALEADPAHGWARYMRAMSLDRLGDDEGAVDGLLSVLATSEPVVSESAAAALDAFASGRRRLSLEAGVILDGNPSYAAESTSSGGARTGIELSGSGDLTLLGRGRHRVRAGVVAVERAFLEVSEDRADWTEAVAWLGYRRLGTPAIVAEYRFTAALFGHEPFAGSHSLGISGSIRGRSVSAGLSASLFHRDAWNTDFAYLGATGASLEPALEAEGERWQARLSYGMQREWASPVTSEVTEADLTVQTTLDYSSWSHGPGAEAALRLPWDLWAEARAAAAWRSFDEPERARIVSAEGEERWAEERRDLRLHAALEVGRDLGAGFAAIAGVSYLANLSTLEPPAPVDRRYSRIAGTLGVRWGR